VGHERALHSLIRGWYRHGCRNAEIMTRVAIAGAIASYPFGGRGNTWAFLQYVLGFMRLGCEVLYVEELGAEACRDEHGRPSGFAGSANARYFADLARAPSARRTRLAAGRPGRQGTWDLPPGGRGVERRCRSVHQRLRAPSRVGSLARGETAGCTSTWIRASRRFGRRGTAVT